MRKPAPTGWDSLLWRRSHPTGWRAAPGGVWGRRPQKLNNTKDINANSKWKCNKVMVKSTKKLSSIENLLTALTLDLELQFQESYDHDPYTC